MQNRLPLADVSATLALATDLGSGRPLGFGLRRCLSVMAEAERLGFSAEARRRSYYLALLLDLGCTATATDRAGSAGTEFKKDEGRRARRRQLIERGVASRLLARLGLDERTSRLVRLGETDDPEDRQVVELLKGADALPADASSGPDARGYATAWAEAVAAEPAPETQIETTPVLEVMADFTDLKSPFFLGHSRKVARLAATAARTMGLSDEEVGEVGRSGLIHDIGRVGITSRIWNKAEPLASDEMELVRTHPSHTDDVLRASSSFRRLSDIARCHHECLDGTGYHRGLRADELEGSARVLAAADDYSALTEPRPHRPAMDEQQAERVLRHFVDGGCLAPEAVDAVLSVRQAGAAELTTDLTDERMALVRMGARGKTPKRIAEELGIKPREARRKLQALQTELGLENQAVLRLFALEAGLLPD